VETAYICDASERRSGVTEETLGSLRTDDLAAIPIRALVVVTQVSDW